MLINNYVEEAGHFLANCQFPEHEQNIQLCKFLFYKGYYKGLVGELNESGLLLSQALRKTPENHLRGESRALKNFKLLTQKHLIVVSLLRSEMPNSKLFREIRLKDYKKLVLLVSKGHFSSFREHMEKCKKQFTKDLVFPLLQKLTSVVLKNGLKKLSQAYSSLSVTELLYKLGLHNEKKLQVDAFLAKVMSKMSRFTLDSNLKTVVFQREERMLSDDSIRRDLAKRIEHVKSLEEQMVHALKFPEEKEEKDKEGNVDEDDEFDLDDLDFSFDDFF
jgi:26S proteasome regulatory subunit N3